MSKSRATRVILLLIIAVFIWKYVEKRNDLQCFVMQQADMLEFVFTAGYASEDEIRDIVWNDTMTAFHGQAWRISLDQLFHAIFMGGSRGQQVLRHLTNPPDVSPDFYCEGLIEWTIWHKYNFDDYDTWSYSGTDITTIHQVTTTLQAIPDDELWDYEVGAHLQYYRIDWNEGNTVWSLSYRDAGSVSAALWLRGKIVPDYWSGWYATWLEQWQEFQATEDVE
ncbi:MAG: hypothetical protein OXG39_13655 [Chloroflexi bacterium]|nr:hypothetical protein [Chloroflexota bacterium]